MIQNKVQLNSSNKSSRKKANKRSSTQSDKRNAEKKLRLQRQKEAELGVYPWTPKQTPIINNKDCNGGRAIKEPRPDYELNSDEAKLNRAKHEHSTSPYRRSKDC